MNERRKLEEKIRKKQEEIQQLELQWRDATVYLKALQDVLKWWPRAESTGDQEPSLREGSAISMAREIILTAGHPVHIRDLLAAMGRDPTRENRVSLASSLSAYVRRGEIFTRTGPGTFGLVESGHVRTAEQPVPPDDFGEDA